MNKRRYISKTLNGRYLDIYFEVGRCYIGWWDQTHNEFSYIIGEATVMPPEPPKNDIPGWEDWVAHFVIAPFSSGRNEKGFFFENETYARKAVDAANRNLFDARPKFRKPEPRWAGMARKAGWTPPEGWKP